MNRRSLDICPFSFIFADRQTLAAEVIECVHFGLMKGDPK